MAPIKPCNTYHAALSGRDIYRGADAKTVFKVYFIDIFGRKDPTRTVWAQCGMTKQQFMAGLAKTPDIEGVGFIKAFPHIAKAFRFRPEAEIVLNVRAWSAKDTSPLNLARSQGYVEFACLAEAAIAAEECAHWAAAQSVEEYLGRWAGCAQWPISRNDKLLKYWNG